MKLLVLDGNSIANRAFYGIKLLTTKDGRYTNAIYGFMNILLNLLRDNDPDEVAVAFDLKAPTFRHKMFDGYKATRHGMPQELADQMPVLKELLADLGFAMVSLEGYEADDLLGTLSAAAAARGDDCLIATGDRDSLQLVNEHVTVLLAATRMGRSETVVMDEAAVEEALEKKRRFFGKKKQEETEASKKLAGEALECQADEAVVEELLEERAAEQPEQTPAVPEESTLDVDDPWKALDQEVKDITADPEQDGETKQ